MSVKLKERPKPSTPFGPRNVGLLIVVLFVVGTLVFRSTLIPGLFIFLGMVLPYGLWEVWKSREAERKRRHRRDNDRDGDSYRNPF